MTENKKHSHLTHYILPFVSVLFLTLTALYYLAFKNSDMLFMAQLRSYFASGGQFFSDSMSRPGGLLQWTGCWFTQLFYHPWLGSSVLTTLWVVTFLVLKKAYAVPSSLSPLLLVPLFCLLASEIDLGYWMYYLKHPGYYFRETFGVLTVALLVWLSRVDRYAIVGSVVSALSYPLIGFYSPLALLCILVSSALRRRWVSVGLSALGAVSAPLLFSRLYTTMRVDEIFTVGFPQFELGSAVGYGLDTPFVIAVVSLLLFPLLRLVGDIRGKLLYVTSAAYAFLAAGAVMTMEKCNYDDANYIAECKAYRAVDEQRWDDALQAVREVSGSITRELIMLKNIALFNTGDIGDRMYDYDDSGLTPDTGDSLKVHIVNIAGPLIYMHHGMMNYAHRWATENMVENGLCIGDLKVILQTALVSGDYDMAEKYINILSRTMYYKDWAERYRPILRNHKLIDNYSELAKCRELHRYLQYKAGTDEGLCEKYIIDYYSTLRGNMSPYVQNMALVYAMISKDIQRFWPQYLRYVFTNKGKDVPLKYQEAAYMYGMLEPHTAPDPNYYGLVFDRERVIDRYNAFNQTAQQFASTGMSNDAIGASMESQYGDTFWWAYFFNTSSTYY